MLNIGVIGFGGRISRALPRYQALDIPFRVAAVADPRVDEIVPQFPEMLDEAARYTDADAMLAEATLDGVMIGTRCHLHTDLACKVAPLGLPLFLEKPVAITREQCARLAEAFRNVSTPVVVSFPLRVTPIARKVREIIASSEIGTVEHAVGWNDVGYGHNYFKRWHRNIDETGGLFLQKATHDLDMIHHLMGREPRWICAMKAQRVYGEAGTVYGGDRPYDLRCADCDAQAECPESPFNLFYRRGQGARVEQDTEALCAFAKGIELEDMGQCIIEYEGGPQATYTQNFFVRNRAHRRGARLYGYRGTIDFDFYRNDIKVYRHDRPTVDTIDFGPNVRHHFGGDEELAFDFLMAMKEGRTPRSRIRDGILSALTCVVARESAETRQFLEIEMPC